MRATCPQCLNFTRLPPSQRSQYKLDCALDEGPSAACPVGAAFDPDAPTYCTFDIGGRAFPGLCDPNGHCYDVYKYDQAVKSVRVRSAATCFAVTPWGRGAVEKARSAGLRVLPAIARPCDLTCSHLALSKPTLQDIVDMFATSNNLDNFNRFTNWYDTQATLALAKVGGRGPCQACALSRRASRLPQRLAAPAMPPPLPPPLHCREPWSRSCSSSSSSW